MAKKKSKKKASKVSKKKAGRSMGGMTKKAAKKTTKKAGKKAGKKTTKKAGKKKARRTVMYSSKGKKLYAVRSKDGQFKDIQQYSRAHAADLRRKSSAETSDAAPSMGEMSSDNGMG